MKTKPVVAFLLLMFAASLGNAAIEFSGYAQTGSESKFVLVDSEAKQSSGWLEMGETFRGHKLIGFERKGEVLSVQKGDETLQLSLRTSRVANSAATMELSAASAELALWMKASEPPTPSGTPNWAVFNSSRRPPPTAEELKVRNERKAKVAQLLTPFRRAYLDGRDADARQPLKGFGIVVDATGRAHINPEWMTRRRSTKPRL